MNRREMGKGVLSFFAGLTCSIPFVKGKERKWVSVMDPRTREQYERDRKLITVITWTSVEDELPKPTDSYLVRFKDGTITTIGAGVVDWFFTSIQREVTNKVTHWAHLSEDK